MSFNRFEHISHRPLRIYNRAVMYYNIRDDHGKVPAQEYAESFSPEERLEIAQMLALVKRKGVKAVQAFVTSGVEFPAYPVEESVVDRL